MTTIRDQLRSAALAVGIGLGGLLVGVVLTLGTLTGVRALGIAVGIAGLLVISLVMTQGVAFGAAALAYIRLRDLGSDFVPIEVPSVRDLIWTGTGYVLAFVAVVGALSVVTLLGLQPAQNQVGEIGFENPEVILLLIPASFLLIGPGEELLFRGLVQGTLRETMGPVGAVGLASAIFAAVHVVALTGPLRSRLITIGILFLPSLVFGTAYERTRNLAVPALIHGAYNATLFTLFYVGLRFGVAQPPGAGVLLG